MTSNPKLIAQILDTLPPFVAGRDRQFHFEEDSLVYKHEEGEWEPPRPIDGFKTNSNDSWRLQSLWSYCEARLHTAVRFPACGCIGLVSRCNEPKARFMQRVTFDLCQHCPLKIEQTKDRNHAM